MNVLKDFIVNKIINIDFINIVIYFIPTIIFSLLVIMTNSKELFRQLEDYAINNESINKFVANLKYLFFRIISFTLTFIIFKYTLEYILKLNNYFANRNLYVFDWLNLNIY